MGFYTAYKKNGKSQKKFIYINRKGEITNMLNEQQRKAVECFDKPALVLAGAGSGKTTVLIEKIQYLIAEKGLHPSRILALTFSNKAAKEMRERATKKIVHEHKYQLELSTFHSFCLKLLKKEAHKTKYANPDFKLYEPDDVQSVIKQIVKEFKWQYTKRNAENFVNTKNVANYISFLKNEMIDAKTFVDEQQSNEYQDWPRILKFIEEFDYEVLEKIQKIYTVYERKMKAMNAMDFDDLLFNAASMMLEEVDIREKYINRYEYVMIDEFQDTNRVQYVFTYLLTKDKKKITVVG
jgi:DNA helicase-2/ATP-dependent DNA helicase PcrA